MFDPLCGFTNANLETDQESPSVIEAENPVSKRVQQSGMTTPKVKDISRLLLDSKIKSIGKRNVGLMSARGPSSTTNLSSLKKTSTLKVKDPPAKKPDTHKSILQRT